MRIIIQYDSSIKPNSITFHKTEEVDSEIFVRILEKVIGDDFQAEYRSCNFTFVSIKSSTVEIQLENGKLQSFSFQAETNLIQRIIHYTVANHFYTVQSEVALVVRNK